MDLPEKLIKSIPIPSYELIVQVSKNTKGELIYSRKDLDNKCWFHTLDKNKYVPVIVKLGKSNLKLFEQQCFYKPSSEYTPCHLKNLRRGVKLFLNEKLPGFKRDPNFFIKK